MKLDILLTSKAIEAKPVEEAKDDAMQAAASSVENIDTTNLGGPSSAAYYEPQDDVIGGSDQKSCAACTFLNPKSATSCSICGGT